MGAAGPPVLVALLLTGAVASPADVTVSVDPSADRRPVSPLIFGVQHLAARAATQGHSGVRFFALDNEPALWNETHHDVFPNPLTYDTYWARTQQYAAAIKQKDPSALVFGPADWGWRAYFFSPADTGRRQRHRGRVQPLPELRRGRGPRPGREREGLELGRRPGRPRPHPPGALGDARGRRPRLRGPVSRVRDPGLGPGPLPQPDRDRRHRGGQRGPLPGRELPPATSTLNFVAGATRANDAIVGLGANAALRVRSNQASGSVHLILDANGYFE